MVTADVSMVKRGTAVLECRVADHVAAGMRALYRVGPPHRTHSSVPQQGPAAEPAPPGRRRKYFIAAEEVGWDYAPLGRDACGNASAPFTQQQGQYVERTVGRTIGSVYRKALYRCELAACAALVPSCQGVHTLNPGGLR